MGRQTYSEGFANDECHTPRPTQPTKRSVIETLFLPFCFSTFAVTFRRRFNSHIV